MLQNHPSAEIITVGSSLGASIAVLTAL